MALVYISRMFIKTGKKKKKRHVLQSGPYMEETANFV